MTAVVSPDEVHEAAATGAGRALDLVHLIDPARREKLGRAGANYARRELGAPAALGTIEAFIIGASCVPGRRPLGG
jgi:hypothetical protein